MLKTKREHIIKMYVSDDEDRELREQSEIAGLTISEFCRRRVFGRKIVAPLAKTDMTAVATLRQLGGLLKQIYKSNVVDTSATYDILKKISLAVSEIRRGVGGAE